MLASDLKEISRRRKASLNLDSEDTGKMLRDVTRNLPMNEALTRILRQTFDLSSPGQSGAGKREPEKKDRTKRKPRDVPPFHPQRFPSTFRVKGGDAQERGVKLFQLPQGGSRAISFATDVENDYFDRTDDPGELKLAILAPSEKGNGGGGQPEPTEEADLLDVTRASPSEGTIKVGVRASSELKVGATVKLQATLSSPEGDLVETIFVRITDPERKPKVQRPEVPPPLGLPEPIFCSEVGGPGIKSWEDINAGGIDMDHSTVVYPLVDDDKLAGIYINLDSSVLKDFKTKATSPEATELAERRYISAVYFHTLFLFATTRSRHYELARIEGEQREEVDLADYVSDLFKSSYAQFLLNFDTADLLEALG